MTEKHIDLYTRGLRGLILGLGFVIVSGASFAISMRLAVLGIFAMAFAVIFLGTGISRLVQAKALKQLREPDHDKHTLTPGQEPYLELPRSIYETDELPTTPHSVTDHTTRHLELEPDPPRGETKS